MKFRSRKLLVLETNLDDMSPQWYEPLMDRLFKAGALDVVLIPSIMKKSRPAVMLQVLTEPKRQDKCLEIIFAESTTLGIRSYHVNRFELSRKLRRVKTDWGELMVKEGRDRFGRLLNQTPEFESAKALSYKQRVPLKKIYHSLKN